MARKARNLWDITEKISTKTKLEIIRKIFGGIWLTIWCMQNWIDEDWYVLDLFAGRGSYLDKNKEVSGSPLIFLEEIKDKKEKISDVGARINLFFVEANSRNCRELKLKIEDFTRDNPDVKDLVNIEIIKNDCNVAVYDILKAVKNSKRNPMFVLIDPTGLQIRKDTIRRIVNLKNPKDILFNYILEGVRRASGVAAKAHFKEGISERELKTVETLRQFIGDDVEVIGRSDLQILEDYIRTIFEPGNLKVTAYDVKYPNRNDELYYLLFASKKPTITEVVRDIYARQKESLHGPTLFGGREFYKSQIPLFGSELKKVTRRSLLYRSKVEYGSWSINHIVGCMHGCKFPCYAMMMAKKFGWIRTYDEWRNPSIVSNALDLLEVEVPKFKKYIDFVHLSFMTDPFMYNSEARELIPEIKELTLEIIKFLNSEGIRVTVLTKGIYPDDLIDPSFLNSNEYGITLVSLNRSFKERFEPFSAPYEQRIESLRKLHGAGKKTWVSIEPYPTPNLDEEAYNIEKILEKINFVDKIIFGKLNYNVKSTRFRNNKKFYEDIAGRVVQYCVDKGIKYHIKHGTPLSMKETQGIFKS